MSYVRKRGKQLVIVRGQRDPATSKVGQEILFTLYSRPEAEHAIGPGQHALRSMLEERDRGIGKSWKQICTGIRSNLDVLPSTYDYGTEHPDASFGRALAELFRQLAAADPWVVPDSIGMIERHHEPIGVLLELLAWRGRSNDKSLDEPGKDSFHWRYREYQHDPPNGLQELVEAYFDRGQYEHAAAWFRMMVQAFPLYVDGHNYLGLIALDADRLDEAAKSFRRAIEVGQEILGRRVARRDWWQDHRTRPYLRGVMNLVAVLDRLGQDDEAFSWCDRLEHEHAMPDAARTARALIHLNRGEWTATIAIASRFAEIWPEHSLLVAFAGYELGDPGAALAPFLHAALNVPATTAVLCGRRSIPAVYGFHDDRQVRSLPRALDRFRTRQTPGAVAFFKSILGAPAVVALQSEAEAVSERHAKLKDHARHRVAFKRMQEMESREFAEDRAADLRDELLPRALRATSRAARGPRGKLYHTPPSRIRVSERIVVLAAEWRYRSRPSGTKRSGNGGGSEG